MYTLLLKNNNEYYEPIIEGDVVVEWSRGFQAGTLTFTVAKDEVIDYQEGNPVILMKDDEVLFYGYVWKKKRNKNQLIKTTCYDQLRYLKYKDSYQYEDKTYSELVKEICADKGLSVDEEGIIDSKYKIPGRLEMGVELFSIFENASNQTTTHEGKEYVLFDKAGKICLQPWDKLKVDTVIDYDVAVDFDYETSIDNAYNRIKVEYMNNETMENEVVVVEDEENIKNWGILQYYVETSTLENVQEKAKILLELLNKKNRSLTIKNGIGNWDVRAGSLVPVQFQGLGDININSMMLVNTVTHRIQGEHHFMDLTVFNKDIMPSWSGDGAFDNRSSSQSSGGDYGEPVEQSRASFLDYATAQNGKAYSQDYRMSANSFDCSSLVLRSMRAAGLDTTGENLTTRSIHNDSRFIQINKNELKPGDVLWKDGHVAIYTGNGNTFEAKNPTAGVGYGKMGNRFTKFYRIKGMS